MKNNKSLIIFTLIPVAFILLSALSFASDTSVNENASSDSSLEDILEGFEGEKQDSTDKTDLDNILEGFEEEQQDSEDNTGLDDILDGFDEGDSASTTSSEETDQASVINPAIFSLDGYFKLGSSYNFAHDAPDAGETDWRGFSRIRAELQLDLNIRFSRQWQGLISGKGFYDAIYEINGRDEYTEDVLDNYENELEFREVYLQGRLTDKIDIKLGRQIMVWGKSDNIRVTDVLNPMDMREPGLTDIEDLRLPAAMTRLDYYIGKWNLSGIAIHEIRFNKLPEFGSDFYPGTMPLQEDVPSDSLRNTEFALSLSGIFSGWDIAIYYAYVFDDMPHMEKQFFQKHSRLHMFGAAYNIALGNWLLKAEAAYFDGMEFFNTDQTYSRFDILAGIEYSGFTDTKLSIEAVNRHLIDFDTALENPPDNANENEFQSAVRLEKTFWNETLKFTLLASTFGITGEDGAFQRFSAVYDAADALEIIGGIILYQSGDLARYRNIGDSDRLFFEIKYSF